MNLKREKIDFQKVVITLESQAEVDALFAILANISTNSEKSHIECNTKIPDKRKAEASDADVAWLIYEKLEDCV